MVSRTSADDFPWYPHEVELDLPERDAKDPFCGGLGPNRHPLVHGKGLRVHLDSGSGPKTPDALRRSFGRYDLQLNSTGNSGAIWFPSVRAAEKALVIGPSVFPEQGSQKIHLEPLHPPRHILPIPAQTRLLTLTGTPAGQTISEVYDLVRPWGAISTLRKSPEGDGDWEVGFWRESDALLWEKDWEGGHLSGMKVSITVLPPKRPTTPPKTRILRQLPPTPISPYRGRRASLDIDYLAQTPAPRATSDVPSRGWIAQYHGSSERTAVGCHERVNSRDIDLMDSPSTLSSRTISGVVERPGAWATLRCSNIPPRIDSPTLFRNLNTVCSVINVKLARKRDGGSRGVASLTFESWEVAAHALRQLQGIEILGTRLLFAFEQTRVAALPRHRAETGTLTQEGLQVVTSDLKIASMKDAPPQIIAPIEVGTQTTDISARPVSRSVQTDEISSTKYKATQTDIGTSTQVGIQTDDPPWPVSLWTQTNGAAPSRSVAVQSGLATDLHPISFQEAKTQTDEILGPVSSSTQTDGSSISRSTAAQFNFETPVPQTRRQSSAENTNRWKSLPPVSVDSLAELLLHPALQVWVWLLNASEEARTAFKLREPDVDMQRLSIRWLETSEAKDEESLRRHVSANLARLLKTWGYRQHGVKIAEKLLGEEDVPSVMMLMNCYPIVLRDMITRKRFLTSRREREGHANAR